MSNPTTPFSWQMPTATDLVTDLPADFEVFGQAVATSMADLLGGTTGQILSKTSATDMDFTWIANDQGDITGVTAGNGISVTDPTGPVPTVAINTAVTADLTTAQTLTNKTLTSPVLTTPSISNINAKADILVGTADNTLGILSVGTNGQVLTADSTVSPSGLKWATPSGGSPFAADIVVNSLTVGKGGGSIATNTALGINALVGNSTGVSVTAIGCQSLAANTANYQTAVGSNSLAANTSGSENVAVGFDSLKTQTGANFNTAVGNSAGKVITSSSNTAIGHQALLTATTGTNTAVGKNAGFSIVTGDGVTAVGKECLRSVTGGNNTAIGNEAGYNLTTGTNNIIIGHNAQAAAVSSVDSVTFGNAGISAIRCQTTTISGLSDVRDKKDIEPLAVGLDFINTLKPVTFNWNMRPTMDRDGNEVQGAKIDVPDTGFIAQDLVAAEDGIDFASYLKLTLRDNPDKLEATPGRLIPILVKAIQDLSAKVAALEAAQ